MTQYFIRFMFSSLVSTQIHMCVWICYFNGWRSLEIATDRFSPSEAYAFTQYKPRDKPANGYNYVAQPSNGKCICCGVACYTRRYACALFI